MSRSRLLILLLGLPLLLLAGPVAANAAAASSLDVVDSATLVAKGAGVEVGLSGTCDVGESGVFAATVSQTVGTHLAGGSGFVVVTCTGEPQQVTVLVVADIAGRAFHPGDALVTATLTFGCCTQISTQEVVRIRR
jgi:hypothetical protein